MTRTPGSRFTLLDAMALVAATAVGLALTLAPPRGGEPFALHHLKEGLLPSLAPLTRQVILGWSVVVMWTLALVALRLRGPRPAGGRRFATPGMAACVVAAIMIALEVGYGVTQHWAFRLLRARRLGPEQALALLRWLKHGVIIAPAAGFAVAAWWATMALSGRWRPSRDWLDRAGRVVGALWIALGLLMFHLRTNANFNYR